MKQKMFIVVLLVLGGFLAGCQKPPEQELAGAREALSAAESAEAGTYAASELQAAKDALAAVNAEVEAQNQKFALFRNYDQAKKLITDANTAAATAKTAAAEGKAKAREEAENALAAANGLIGEASTALDELAACPKKPKGFEADLEALRGRLDGLSAETAGIESAIQAEQFSSATTSAGQLSEQVQTLLTDLQGAKEKLKC